MFVSLTFRLFNVLICNIIILINKALSAVIVSAVVKNVIIPKKLLQLRGNDSLVGFVTAMTTAITSPTLGFGCGVILYAIISFTSAQPKKKVA